jgi:cysteine desulfurase family protein (TIGR01976 family)
MPPFDVAAIRAQFPALRRQQDGRPVVFLDGPGGTQVPDRVIDAVSGYYRTMNANSGGAFVTSQATDALAAATHAAVATFLGAASPDEVKLGANMTTLTFHVSRAIAATFAAGDEIVVTTLDHEANVSPWRAIAADRGLVVRTVDIHPEDGTLDLDSLDAALGPRTRLAAFGYASNALGTVSPVGEIIRRIHAAGALAYVDAVHFAPHGSIDVAALDADFLVCSVYKWFGPHLGALYGKAAVLDHLPAYKVRPAHDRFETGTPSFEAYAGTLAAVDYLRELGRTYGSEARGAGSGDARQELVAAMDAIVGHERALASRMLDGLVAIPGLRLWGIADPARLAERTPTFAVTIAGTSPAEAAAELGRAGIFTWDGDFYARGLIERLGLFERGGVLRLGLVHYSTDAEVDRTLEALATIAARVAVGSRPVAR